MKINAICLAIALTALACGESTTPPVDPTPVPTEVVVPTPAATIGPNATPVPVVPCKALPPNPGVLWSGDCEVTEECRSNGDGTYSGTCHTKAS